VQGVFVYIEHFDAMDDLLRLIGMGAEVVLEILDPLLPKPLEDGEEAGEILIPYRGFSILINSLEVCAGIPKGSFGLFPFFNFPLEVSSAGLNELL
jgi:hypothetical protein